MSGPVGWRNTFTSPMRKAKQSDAKPEAQSKFQASCGKKKHLKVFELECLSYGLDAKLSALVLSLHT